MDKRGRKRDRIYVWSALVLALFCGCDKNVIIVGQVLDQQGEGLPGVAVTVRGSNDQAITDGRGGYRLRSRGGEVELDLVKSGYTLGRIRMEVEGPSIVDDVVPATLLALPPGKGVYLYGQYRYRSTTPHEPKRYLVDDAVLQRVQLFHGTKLGAQIETALDLPVLISYKLPPYDVRLSRLEQREARDTKVELAEYREQVWLPVASYPVYAAALDEPEGALQQLNLTEPLLPGVYAVHWGALEGQTDIDPRAFLFRVIDPMQVEEAVEEGEGEEEGSESES